MTEPVARSGLRHVIVQVLFYSAVAVMPASVPVVHRDVEYPLVQALDGPVLELDELVAQLASVS